MLDIERGDIVGQQHNLITEEVMLIRLLQPTVRNTVQKVHDEAASANAGINNLNMWLRNRCTEFALQQLFHTGTHKIDDLLWCIDNAICIRSFYRIALEESFIDR